MARFGFLACVASAVLAMSWGATARAQSGYGQMTAGGQPAFRAPGSYERISGSNNPALTFFGGRRNVPRPGTLRMQSMPAPQPVQTAAYAKPHSNLTPPPSVTPYLALDQRESEVGIPNYYMFVKPALEQTATNQAQQMQNRRLQNQIRRAMTTGIMPTGASGGMPTTGHSTQFMNNGGYYPGLK
ncbi:MAG TPA: hypothetical protein VEQ85_02205 [Lacipirellulaceae bacterium]|nr:hypothetical protein [Lacipirellulaceae bacterium]